MHYYNLVLHKDCKSLKHCLEYKYPIILLFKHEIDFMQSNAGYEINNATGIIESVALGSRNCNCDSSKSL